MKLQYLGDSKDSFKWDYHDYLVSELAYPVFNIALMMTPDDKGDDGKSHPALFPARGEIIRFCHDLRQARSIESIRKLPVQSGSSYEVLFHKGGTHISNNNRIEYFCDFNNVDNQLLFLDPDNGFEPEKSCGEKHVKYSDISRILEQLSSDSVVTVFQHHRRILFPVDYARIKERLESGYSTAIYWHSLMFVAVACSERAIGKVVAANEKYARLRPVKVLA